MIVLEHEPARARQVYWTAGKFVVVFSHADAVEHLRRAGFAGDVIEREAMLGAVTADPRAAEPLGLDELLAGYPDAARLRAAYLVAAMLESGRAALIDAELGAVRGAIQLVRFSDRDYSVRRFETRDGELVLEIVDARGSQR